MKQMIQIFLEGESPALTRSQSVVRKFCEVLHKKNFVTQLSVATRSFGKKSNLSYNKTIKKRKTEPNFV